MDAPESDVILSSDMEFDITNEPFYHIVTFNNTDKDEDGVVHRYEHILKIARRSAECEYTMNEYEQVIDLYEEACTKVIGVTHDSPTHTVDVEKTFEVGDEIVTKYAVYATDYSEDLHYLDADQMMQRVTIFHMAGDILLQYAKYDHTEYDEEGRVVHAKGDVMLDDNNQFIYSYVPTQKQFHWNLVNTISDSVTNDNGIEEPLD